MFSVNVFVQILIQSLVFFEPQSFSLTLHTIDLTYSVGSVTGIMISSANIWSNSTLYKGRM